MKRAIRLERSMKDIQRRGDKGSAVLRSGALSAACAAGPRLDWFVFIFYKKRKEFMLNVSIFGLGYVGAGSAGFFFNVGHKGFRIDPVQKKIELINNGRSPLIATELDNNNASTGFARLFSA